MATEGVFVHLKDPIHQGASKYNHHSVILSSMRTDPYLWHIPTRLNLRLLITYPYCPPADYNPRHGYEFFFFAKLNPMAQSSIILFREDLKPLHPKHVQALWKFLKHLKRKFLPTAGPLTENACCTLPKHQVRDDYSDRIWTLGDFWDAYCTQNNFSAFFDVLRHQKLMEGDESWRDVKSPYLLEEWGRLF